MASLPHHAPHAHLTYLDLVGPAHLGMGLDLDLVGLAHPGMDPVVGLAHSCMDRDLDLVGLAHPGMDPDLLDWQ